ncbi:alpha-1-antitrypsin-like [Spea bombifrons]|uniref:alpha-1-antitrypsin-like n=1 Tax=Spea bombifrons TaxID=233779 RepID=UPI00234B16F2|nr:alpha-1-antitrypsin-like [Spea bombifrons]
MKVLLFVTLSTALLCTLVLSDHGGSHDDDHSHDHDHDHDQDHHHDHDHDHHHDHDHKHNESHHHHHHGDGKYHHHHGDGNYHHHHTNESMACHRIAKSNANFAFHFFNQIASRNPTDNIFFSPVSISIAFALLSKGARSKTHDQIIEGLGFNVSKITKEEIHAGFKHLLHILNDPNSELQLNSGNALFINKESKLLQTFLDDAKNFYESEAFSTDFQNTEEAKKQINSYVEKQTNGKIVDLLDSVDKDTILVLLNYIYFRGKWEKPFEEEFTKEGDFHVDENTVVKVPMMHRTGMYNVLLSENCSVVELPYKGNASALFILPKEGHLREVEESLEKAAIKNWRKSFWRRSVDLTLPKFSISATLDLKNEFEKLGVTEVFTNTADLSGITGEANVKLSKAVHKAVLNVDEKGTEAAAVTALEIMPMSLPPAVKFDHPFLIVIADDITHSVLFLGRISNPAKK